MNRTWLFHETLKLACRSDHFLVEVSLKININKSYGIKDFLGIHSFLREKLHQIENFQPCHILLYLKT